MKKRDDRSALLLGKIVSWDDERAKDTTKFCTEMLSLQKCIRAENFPTLAVMLSSLREVLETSQGHVPGDGCPELAQPAQKVSQCLALRP